MHRIMHISDVISSVSMSSKSTKNRCRVVGWGFAPDPNGGAYSAPPELLAEFKGAYFKVPTSKGRGRKGEGVPK